MMEQGNSHRVFFAGLTMGIFGCCLVAALFVGVRVVVTHHAPVQTFRNGLVIGLCIGFFLGLVAGVMLAAFGQILDEEREEKLLCSRTTPPPLGPR